MLKRILRKTIPYLIATALLMGGGFYVYGKSQQYNDVKYSTYNIKKDGAKALYLLTKEMGYRVYRHESSAALFADGATMVIINPDQMALNKLELRLIRNWLEEGNAMLLVGYESLLSSRFAEMTKEPKQRLKEELSLRYYKVGKGKLIFIEELNQLSNEKLTNYKPAAVFIRLVAEAGNRDVYFNEYYHGIGRTKAGGWDIMSPAMRLAVVQVSAAVVLLILSQARRFGTPLVVHENIKRQENEKIFALSNLLMKAKANHVVLEIYQEHFNRDLAKYLGVASDAAPEQLMDEAAGDPLLEKMDIKHTMQRCQDYIKNKRKSMRELMAIMHRLDEIRKVIKA